jgi:hypothetical protein
VGERARRRVALTVVELDHVVVRLERGFVHHDGLLAHLGRDGGLLAVLVLDAALLTRAEGLDDLDGQVHLLLVGDPDPAVRVEHRRLALAALLRRRQGGRLGRERRQD